MSQSPTVSLGLARAGSRGGQVRSRQVDERFDLPDFIELCRGCGLTSRRSQRRLALSVCREGFSGFISLVRRGSAFYVRRHFMRYTFIIIVAATLLTACHKKPIVSRDPPTAPPTFATLGQTKGDVLAQLEQMKYRIITNTDVVIIAEIGPEGIITSDGSPVTKPLRSEFDFSGGKLTQSRML